MSHRHLWRVEALATTVKVWWRKYPSRLRLTVEFSNDMYSFSYVSLSVCYTYLTAVIIETAVNKQQYFLSSNFQNLSK